MFQLEGLELEQDASEHLNNYIKELVDNKHKYFGNARTVRKIVKEAIRRQNLRMADLSAKQRNEDMIKTITLDDMLNFKLVESDLPERKGIGFR